MRAIMRIATIFLCLIAGAATAQAAASPLFVVHFETGPAWDKSRAPAEQPGFREHSANLNRLRKEGVIVFGARYGDFGMIFLEAASQDAAKTIIEADPGVRSGIFVFRIEPLSVFYPWQEQEAQQAP